MIERHYLKFGAELLYDTDIHYVLAIKHPKHGWFTDKDKESKLNAAYDIRFNWGYGESPKCKKYKTEKRAWQDIFIESL